MNRLSLIILTAASLLSACGPSEEYNTDGGLCEYEVAVSGTCTFDSSKEGEPSLTFETEDDDTETRVLSEWDAECLTESGAVLGEVLSCAEWENTVGACSPDYLEVTGPLSSCEVW